MSDREALAALLRLWIVDVAPHAPICYEDWPESWDADLATWLSERGVTLTPSLDEGLLARALDACLPASFNEAKPGNRVRAKAIAREYRLAAQERETTTSGTRFTFEDGTTGPGTWNPATGNVEPSERETTT